MVTNARKSSHDLEEESAIYKSAEDLLSSVQSMLVIRICRSSVLLYSSKLVPSKVHDIGPSSKLSEISSFPTRLSIS